jgi:hypothetical protein
MNVYQQVYEEVFGLANHGLSVAVASNNTQASMLATAKAAAPTAITPAQILAILELISQIAALFGTTTAVAG